MEHWWANRTANNPDSELTGPLASVGSAVPLRDAHFAGSPISWVLIASPTCRYCEASVVFHRHVRELADKHSSGFYVVVPHLEGAQKYIARLGVERARVREWADLGVRVPGTPALVAVDKNGVARRLWIGRMPQSIENEIFEVARTSEVGVPPAAGPRNATEYREDEIDDLLAKNVIQLIIPLERADQPAISRGIMMPLEEIAVRAPFELSRSLVQVVDCQNVSSAECDAAASRLGGLGFQVATFGVGARFQSCASTRSIAP